MVLSFLSNRSRRKGNNKTSSCPTSTSVAVTTLSLLALSSTVSANSIYPTEDTNSAGIGAPRQLYTSSAAYCSPPLALLVTALDLKFFPGNNTLEFDLAAASIDPNLNATIGLTVNAYGLGLFDVQLDLCDLGGGLLCPLPTYEFNGGGIFPVPDGLADGLPGIAFTIPDLEAVATLEITNQATGEVVGCVQATLSNGHTTHQKGAMWATVGLAILAALSSILHSCIAQSNGAAQWRIIDVMMSLQHVAIASFLSLTYPIAFISYALNFGWSVGMIDIKPLQNSITSTRMKTGGMDTAVFGSDLTAQTGRKYSPFTSTSSPPTTSLGGLGGLGGINLAAKLPGSPQIESYSTLSQNVKSNIQTLKALPGTGYLNMGEGLFKRQQYAPNTGPDGHLIQSTDSSQIHTIIGNGTSSEGIAMFSERLYIAPDNAFLTVLVSGMIFLGLVLIALLLIYLVALILKKTIGRNKDHGWATRFSDKKEFFGILIPVFLGRFFLITFPIFLIFAFYQWKTGDSWVPDFLAAIFLVFFLVAGTVLFWPMIRYVRKNGGESKFRENLYYDERDRAADVGVSGWKGVPNAHEGTLVKRDGAMAHPYRPRFYWFALVFLGAAVVRAAFIAFAQGHGFVQSVGLLVLEFLFTIVLCILRVGRDKKSDFVFIVLAITRVLSWATCVAFTHEADVTTIPRVIVGFVLIVVTGLPIIFLFFVTVLDLVSPFRKKKLNPVRRDEDGKVIGEETEGEGYQYGKVANPGEGEMREVRSNGGDGLSPNESEGNQQLGAGQRTVTDASGSSDEHDGQPRVY